jgi:hypothetical protein
MSVNFSLTPREEQSLGAFESKVLGKKSDPTKIKVKIKRKYYTIRNEEFHTMFSSSNTDEMVCI